MKAGHDRQLLHGQLLGGLLVTMATAALDLGAAAQVLRSGEPGLRDRLFRVLLQFWTQSGGGSATCADSP